jgi:uncharacterized protein YndB with AHSA1/START domain
VKKEPNGRRSVQVETEVPGSPEEVWQAIATGLGVSAWFVPTEFVEKEGKPVATKHDFGPGMESESTITGWDPPHKFSAESPGWGPGMPSMATEWSVEARAGGVCLVRVVHSLFASTDDWDSQLTGTESGWPGFFRILRLYMTHFRGQPSTLLQWIAPATGTVPEAWASLTTALGLKDARAGQRWQAPAGVPQLAGVIEQIGEKPHGALIRLDKPGPGVALLSAVNCGAVMATFSFYHYGPQAAAVAAREKPLWQAWIDAHFPAPK